MAAQEIITDKTINQVFQRALNARGWVDGRAYEIKHEMARVSVIHLSCQAIILIEHFFAFRVSL